MDLTKHIAEEKAKKSFLQKIAGKIRFWFRHTTMFWIAVDGENNVVFQNCATIFDKVLPKATIKQLYNSGIVIEDKDWHWIGIRFRRFGRQEFYVDGHQVTNKHFK